MIEVVVLCVLGVLTAEIYVRTKHPKLYALVNSALGLGGILLIRFATAGEIAVTGYNSAFSAILGIPGAILVYISQIGG